MELIDKLTNYWKKGVQHRERFRSEWNTTQKKYDGLLLYTPAGWQSNSCEPTVYEQTEVMVSKDMALYFRKPPWQLEARISEDNGRVKKLDKLLAYQVDTCPHWRMKWKRFARWKYIRGVGVVRPYFDMTYGRNDFFVVNLDRFVVEPCAQTIEEAEWVAYELMMKKSDVKQMFDSGEWSVSNKIGITPEQILEQSACKYEISEANGYTEDYMYDDKLHVTEYWYEDKLCIVLQKMYLVYDGPNPYNIKKKPFIDSACVERENTFWANNLTFCIASICDTSDKLNNAAVDLARLKMNPPCDVGPEAQLTTGTIEIRPGMIRNVQAINAISYMKFDGASDAISVAKMRFDQAKKTGTGLTDYAIGNNTASMNDTASGTAIMAENANERIMSYLDNNEHLLKEFGRFWLSFNKQYITDTISIKVKDKMQISTEDISPDDLDDNVDIKINTPAIMLNQQARAQILNGLHGTMKDDPNIDPRAWRRRILEENRVRDPEELILTDQEKVQMAQEQAQLQMQMQGVMQQYQAAMQPATSSSNPVQEATQQGQMAQPAQGINPEVTAGQ